MHHHQIPLILLIFSETPFKYCLYIPLGREALGLFEN
jgi:hypothetical protein